MSDDLQYKKSIKTINIDAAGTFVLRPTGQSAWLHRIIINALDTATATIYNNGEASGEEVASYNWQASAALSKTLEYGIELNNGLTIDVVGSPAELSVTVVYE